MNTQNHSRRRFIASVGTATLAGLAGCSSQGSKPSSPTSEKAEGEDQEQTIIQMTTDNKGSYFDPKGLVIEPGTTVQFVNALGSHATTAYHPDYNEKPRRIPEEAAAWNSETFTNDGETFEHTFEVAGVYDYYCPPHESLGMVGRIVVETPQGGPGTTPPEELPPAVSFPSIETILDQQVVNGP